MMRILAKRSAQGESQTVRHPIFWGPVTTRDGAGDIASIYTHPPRYLESSRTRILLAGLWIIDRRASLLDAEKLIQGDRYLMFICKAANF